MSISPASSSLRFRPWMAIVPAVAIIGAGVAALALHAPLPGVGPIDPATGMRLEVVAPVEPEVQPGGTMEVGPLVDGYTHVAAAPAEPVEAYDPGYQTAWVEPLPPLPEARPTVWRSSDAAQPEPVAAPSGQGGMFGFDAPQPDYAAERRAREAARDRLQAEQAARGRSGVVAADPGLDRDSAFY